MCNGLYHSEKALQEMLHSAEKISKITKNILPGHEPDVFLPGMGLDYGKE